MAIGYFNEISIKKKINQTIKSSRYRGLAESAANTRFVFAKNELLDDYDENEVTKELLAGPATDDSKFLSRGNVFSFVGFFEGDTPAQDLREYVENNVYMSHIPTFEEKARSVTYSFPINVPTRDDLDDSFPTPDNWSNKSWIELIEFGGINNFGAFIYKEFFKRGSRSTTGLQNKNAKKPSGKALGGIKFINALLKEFKAKFKRTTT